MMNFHIKAREEVHKMGKFYKELSESKFIYVMNKFLEKKYYWRSWLVLSYDNDQDGKKHSVTMENKYVYHDVGNNGCDFWIGSTNDNVINFGSKLKYCGEKVEDKSLNFRFSPKDIYQEMKKCLGKFNGLAVVRDADKTNFSSSEEKGPVPFYQLNMLYAVYQVFAIAPEINGI